MVGDNFDLFITTYICSSIDKSDTNSLKEVENSIYFMFNVIIARYVIFTDESLSIKF